MGKGETMVFPSFFAASLSFSLSLFFSLSFCPVLCVVVSTQSTGQKLKEKKRLREKEREAAKNEGKTIVSPFPISTSPTSFSSLPLEEYLGSMDRSLLTYHKLQEIGFALKNHPDYTDKEKIKVLNRLAFHLEKVEREGERMLPEDSWPRDEEYRDIEKLIREDLATKRLAAVSVQQQEGQGGDDMEDTLDERQ
eukprot:TRINITY_DN7780_c0_g1_i2.p3 TRINITY_DN7780_c0_g1~~TRINITY_DN7780_c0_g1_i2.p3  ORF type:complete len:194 (-),score=88.89 TRINITY_DN7780_c0_g1_i2:34-615(-)